MEDSGLQCRIAIEEIFGNGLTAACFGLADKAELDFINTAEHGGDGACVYGDTEDVIVTHLFQTMLERPLSSDDTFCDLGSGSGKLMLSMWLFTPVSVAGIELSPTRHEQACTASLTALPGLASTRPDFRYQALRAYAEVLGRRILPPQAKEEPRFFCASMLQHEELSRTTLAYCYALALSDLFLVELHANLQEVLPVGAVVLLRGKAFPSVAKLGASSMGRMLKPVLQTKSA